MASANGVYLIGRLCRDPQLRFTPNQTAVCEFSLAVDDGWGENKKTCFVDVVAWKGTAEAVQKFCTKGSQVFVEGRLTFEQWKSKDGQKRSKHKVVAKNVQFLDSKGSARSSGTANAPGDLEDERVPF